MIHSELLVYSTEKSPFPRKLRGLMAVSYTHLDVYKRQIYTCACDYDTCAFDCWQRVSSVSYTHLDVYKRQAMDTSNVNPVV